MRALVLHEQAQIERSPLRWEEVPPPWPGAREVRVRVSCCAVCRTDLHLIEGELPWPPGRSAIIPGHQAVGIVDAVGSHCTQVRVGQRVGIAWLRETCQSCAFCESGRENLCERSAFSGYHADGGYAEQALVREDFCYAIPDAFDDVQAAPLLCAGIIGYRALKRCVLPDGGTLALYGFGSSAHIALQIARHRGCDVYVVTRGAEHRSLAERMGARWAGQRPADLPVKVDSAILFAPAGELVPTALDGLKKGGTLAVAGIHLSDIPPLRYQQHLFYERDLRSVTANTRADGRELLDEAARIPIRPHTTRFPLQYANRALQALKADRINGTGVLIVS
jgi:propanol-preferring alcohol dehydrogenase